MNNVTDVIQYTSPIQVLANGDPVDQSVTTPTIQGLANRTAYLNLGMAAGIVVSAAGTTTLTVQSPRTVIVTGTSAQTIKLPDETTLPVGDHFKVINRSTGSVTVQDSAATTLTVLQTLSYADCFSGSAAAATGNWVTIPVGQLGQLIGPMTGSVSLTVPAAAVTSALVLPAGTFNIFAALTALFNIGTTSTTYNVKAGISQSNMTYNPTTGATPNASGEIWVQEFATVNSAIITTANIPILLASTVTLTVATNFYLLAQAASSAGSIGGAGAIWATRAS